MRLYKHIYNTDVAVQMLHKLYRVEKNVYEVKVRWFNIVNPLNVFVIQTEKVIIKAEDMRKWRRYEV